MMPAGTTFAETGQAVLLPGTHRTSSFLAVAGPSSRRSLHSACHGAGTVVSDHVRRGLSAADPEGRTTRRYRYTDQAPTDAAHYDDNGVNAALDVLVRNGLVTPVARMRPLAVLH
jgi:RNA-splicing ligase RtcB